MAGQIAVVRIRFNASSVSQHMSYVALLLNPVEKVRHGTFGKDSNILDAVGLRIQGHRSLLTVIIIR